MGLIQRVFGDSRPHSQSPSLSHPDTQAMTRPAQVHPQAQSPIGLRRELLRVALRDTLVRHGIPTQWITAEAVPEAGPGPEQRVHLRLQIRHYDPRLLAHGMALQSSFYKRVELFDPMAAQWLHGISWQFAVADPPAGIEMPDPAQWAPPRPKGLRAAVPAREDDSFAATQQSIL
ncbi:MAG: hypothetical protein ABI919_10735 [Ramlibacter sp.]